jgi:hypothetical protein
MALGKANFTSSVTKHSELMTFWSIHFGDHNVAAGVRVFESESAYDALVTDILDSFSRIEIAEVVRLLDRGFGGRTYSLRSLFRDEQRRILHLIIGSTLTEAENAYLHLYENHAALMRFISTLGTTMPGEFRTAIEFALNSLLRQAFSKDELDAGRIQGLLHDAHGYRISLDQTTLEFTLRRTLERLSNRLAADNTYLPALELLRNGLVISKSMPFLVNLRAVQNRAYDVYTRHYSRYLKKALKGEKEAQSWLATFCSVAELLSIYIKEPRSQG